MTDDLDLNRYDETARRMIAAMTTAEGQMLQEAQKAGNSYLMDVTRRQILRGSLAVAGSAAAVSLGSQEARAARELQDIPPGSASWPIPEDPTKELARPTGEDGGYGMRSPFESEVRWRFPTPTKLFSFTFTPLDHSLGTTTPSGLHYEVNHGGTPFIDPAKFELIVHGMVERPTKYTIGDLKRFPSVSGCYFLECAGNTFTEWREPKMKTVQGTHGLTSNSEWTGVPLSTILAEVGVKERATWMLAEGSDQAVMTRSIPIGKCWKDALLAYGQNGEALRPEQGYPLRLFLPGWEGNTNIKWLRRLEFSDAPFMTREETSKYTDLIEGGKARQFSYVMEAKSVITFPSGEMQLPGPGGYEITGLAWSGRGRVRRVEISTDGGLSWHAAELQNPVLSLCHTRFRQWWHWDGKPAILQSRCIDETGYTQPTIRQLVEARGLKGKFGSLYHNNAIQSWAVNSDGSVENVRHVG